MFDRLKDRFAERREAKRQKESKSFLETWVDMAADVDGTDCLTQEEFDTIYNHDKIRG